MNNIESNKDDATTKNTNKAKLKKLTKLLELLHSPSAIAIYFSIVYIFAAFEYYEVRSVNESQRKNNSVFELIDWIDQKTTDARFKLRGEVPPEAPLALLAIDDRSIEEIGRWPWSREKIAFVVQKMMDYGAKAIGFDIVFSEPQEAVTCNANDVQPDDSLAQVFSKYSDRLVLGSFAEDDSRDSIQTFRPFQDYCRNLAFKRANSEKFIKITNLSFVVDDIADPFVDLNFNLLFDRTKEQKESMGPDLFDLIEKDTMEKFLKNQTAGKTLATLSSRETNKLKYQIEDANFKYCEGWLEKNDRFLEASGNIYKEIFKQSPLLKDLALPDAIKKFMSLVKAHPVSQRSHWTINIDKLQENSTYTAGFNAEQDSDGTIRKASLFFRTGNKTGLSFVPSLPLETYLVSKGYRADIEIANDPKFAEQKVISKFLIKDPSQDPEVEVASVPVDTQGRMKINYSGGKNMYVHFPAKELFNDNPTAEILQAEYIPSEKRWLSAVKNVNKADFIKGRSFIFGATAVGVYDLRVTPFEKNFPGPETHLNTMGNLFQRNFIQTSANEERVMLPSLIAVGLIMGLGLAHAGAILGFVITALSALAIFMVDQYLFNQGIAATMALPAILALSLYVILTFYKYFTEERKKKHLRSTFSKYVSPAIVDEILKDPENIELGGKKYKMSVFFSDVRGFTTISEKLDPQKLSEVLNMYLTPMTDIVFANKGTLDKYMGDAVMAFFGAPIHYPDHAIYACRCALQSIEKLKELRQQFKAQGLPEIDIGIGVNTGEMSVGNMGSNTVRSYTVMGDSVNLGSRLEGINKEYGTRIIISEFTYEDVKDNFTAREVDWVRVKGKYKPVRIFELICEGAPPESTGSMVAKFNAGFTYYHEKKFTEAKICFEEALAILPTDPVAKLYIERCTDYLETPPPDNWDGVYVMKTK
jgi:adenylate cyclase